MDTVPPLECATGDDFDPAPQEGDDLADRRATADELALLDRLDQLDAIEAKVDAAVAGVGRIEKAAAGLVAFADDLHERLKPMLESGPFAALARMAGNGRG